LAVGILAGSGITIIAIPVLITYHWCKESYEEEEFIAKYGTLVEGMNSHKALGIYWTSIVLTRWTLTSVIMVLLRDYYSLQICSLLLVSYITQIMIIAGRPLEGQYENEIAVFNEAMVCIYLYFMITLTDYNYLGALKDQYSFCLALVVLLSAGMNFLKFVFLLS
jgi:hypothetical protein